MNRHKIIIGLLLGGIVAASGQRLDAESIPFPPEFEDPRGIIAVDVAPGETSPIRYIVVDQHALHFCNAGMKVMFSRPFVRGGTITASPKGRYLYLKEYEGEPVKYGSVGRTYTMIDFKGKEYYMKSDRYPYDGIEYFTRIISDANGSLFEYDGKTGKLDIYRVDGELSNTHLLFDNENILGGYMDVSEAGHRIAIAVNQQPAHMAFDHTRVNPHTGKAIREVRERQSGNPHLFIFDEDGNQLLNQPIAGDGAAGVSIAPQEDLVLVSMARFGQERSYITTAYNMTGNPLYTMEHIFHNVSFNNQYVIGRSAGGRPMIYLYDRNNGNLVSVKQPEGTILGIEFVADGTNAYAVTYKRLESSPATSTYIKTLYSLAGEKLGETTIEGVPISSVIQGTHSKNRIKSGSTVIGSRERKVNHIAAMQNND